jgi:hypothetical protein
MFTRGFATLGVGLLVPRTARLALAASIAWALGVWYFGEGLSGLPSDHASLTTGAPGSALLLALLAGTDPNSGPLLALMAIALVAGHGRLRDRATRSTAPATVLRPPPAPASWVA